MTFRRVVSVSETRQWKTNEQPPRGLPQGFHVLVSCQPGLGLGLHSYTTAKSNSRVYADRGPLSRECARRPAR